MNSSLYSLDIYKFPQKEFDPLLINALAHSYLCNSPVSTAQRKDATISSTDGSNTINRI